jgi:lipopolysaccharide export system protein LptA
MTIAAFFKSGSSVRGLRAILCALCVLTLPVTGMAQGGSSKFSKSPLGINPTTPINISAESFELRTDDQVGVWLGAVEVSQGKIKLKANKIEVHYLQGEAARKTGQSVKQLRATGNVRITSPDEQAQSAYAVYEVGARMIVMGGDVLLTRGPNVLKGSRLTIDLARNVSKLDPAKGELTAQGGKLPSKGRVSAVIVPPSGANDGSGGNTP